MAANVTAVTPADASELITPEQMQNFTESQFHIEPGVNDLSLHGVIAGTFDFLGLEQTIDAVIGKRSHLMKINHGAAVKAMVMQMLSCPYQSLYRTDEYFSRIPLASLLNQGVEAGVLNRFTLSRMLDDTAAFGPRKLFMLPAGQACSRLGITVQEAHIDSTSFHCDSEEKIKDGCELEIRYGCSRDHRPDLPRVIMPGLVDGVTRMPIYSREVSGNISDHTSFFEMAAKDWPSPAAVFKDLRYLVGDSALCTAPILKEAKRQEMEVVTRVPDGFELAKRCFAQGLEAQLTPVNPQEPDGNSGLWCGTGKIGETEVKLLEKLNKELKTSAGKPAACRADAELNLEKIRRRCSRTWCRIEDDVTYEEVKKYASAGRPKADEEKIAVGVKVHARAVIDEDKLKQGVDRELRCVIATTDLKRRWTMSELLSIYHRQSAIERSRRISKDPRVLINAVYLKKPSRIAALMRLPAVALLVFAAAEYKLRQSAEQSGIKELNLVKEQQALSGGAKPRLTQKNRQLPQSTAARPPIPISEAGAGRSRPQYKLTLLRFKQYVQNCRISIFIDSSGMVQVVGRTPAFKQLLHGMGEAWEYYYRNETYSASRLQELFKNQPMTEGYTKYEAGPII